MDRLMRIESQIIKTDAGEFFNRKLKKFNRDLDKLAPGIYKVIIVKMDTHLASLKRYYFKMETDLAQHLGMSKNDLHKETKRFDIFKRPDPNNAEQLIYDSIADISNEGEMMARIYAFQQWSAENFNYTHEPLLYEGEK